ncbi:MAG: stage II sporulation protein P [Lachnospiraceae bacterium]|nr:stage II sporulation protein P [Lachnospiraceae bacterium]
MRRRKQKKAVLTLAIMSFMLIVAVGVLAESVRAGKEEKEAFLVPFLFREIVYEMQPVYAYLTRGGGVSSPLSDYVWDYSDADKIKEFHLELLKKENEVVAIEGLMETEVHEEEKTEIIEENDIAKAENMKFFAHELMLCAGSGFVSSVEAPMRFYFKPQVEKSRIYSTEELKDFQFVMEHFYTVDASTSPVALNDIEKILAYDCTVDKTKEGPHILIYHTHSQEGFADSRQEDANTLIQGAGNYLAELLREHYGYSVYHHKGCYDIDTRDDAYAKAAPAIESILQQYPQIQVVIDLHRDGVAENRHLVHEVQGVQTAQFMFFNGLSYSNKKGKLDYLPNENLLANLSLSLKLGIAAREYYPGLTRDNYLNAYRYNMHYRDKSLLIELGAQTNTVDEIRNACLPLAHILDLVLSGKETYY